MIDISVTNETGMLREVILGTAESLGGTPRLQDAYDARSRESIRLNIYPQEQQLQTQIEAFASVLRKHAVKVHRTDLLPDTNQVYARDIGFVIGDRFVFPNIIADREHEKDGILRYLDLFEENRVIRMPTGARAEGGDVIVWNKRVYVGYSEKKDFDEFYVSRTNLAGLEFLKKTFNNHEVLGFELVKSDEDPKSNALHLDCCFQPVGMDKCVLCPEGFKNQSDVALLIDHFGRKNVHILTPEEMYDMNSNIFSISPTLIVTDPSFGRLNDTLIDWGFQLEMVEYHEVRKMGGLFRCSTLPLVRE